MSLPMTDVSDPKRRKLSLASVAARAQCSLAAVSRTLAGLIEEGLSGNVEADLGAADSVRRVLSAGSRAHAEATTPYGEVMQHLAVNGVNIPLVSPKALLHYLCSVSPDFASLLGSVASASHDRTLRLVLYADEVTPGNVLRPDAGRKFWAIYWTVCEFPEFFRRSEDSWFTVATIRSKFLETIPGGLSAVMKEFLKHVWLPETGNLATTGLMVPVPGGRQWFRATFCGFCADEAALKTIYNVKGASGTRPCLLCKNIIKNPPSGHPYLKGCEASADQCDLHTDQSFFEQVDLLRAVRGRVGVGTFQQMEKACGINFDTNGLLFAQDLRSIVRPPTCTVFDHMHCLCSQGIATSELGFLVSQMHNAGISVEQVDSFLSLFTLPKKFGSWPRIFLQQRANAATGNLRIFASEVLTLLVLMRQFVICVLGPSGLLPRHCECVLLLCEIARILQLGDKACLQVERLTAVIAQHSNLFQELYPQAVRPKLHYLAHIPAILSRLQVNLSCYVTERKHRESKRAAAGIFRHFERSLIANRLNRMVQAMQDASCFKPCRLVNPRKADWALLEIQKTLPAAREAFASAKAKHPECGWLCRGDFVQVHIDSGLTVGSILSFFSVRTDPGHDSFYVIVSLCQRMSETIWTCRSDQLTVCDLHDVCSVLFYSHEEGDCIRIVLP